MKDTGWTLTQLTFGTSESRFHAHSYYDIPVLDAAGARVAVHRTTFAGRQPVPGDRIEVGLVETAAPGTWQPIGSSDAWSWQQGPMAQWVGRRVVWNDRDGDRFVARLHDPDTGATETLAAPVYAVSPDGATALSLDMARLDRLRPGYGYPGGTTPGGRIPASVGVRRLALDGSAPVLVLPLAEAVAFLHRMLPMRARAGHLVRRYHYWFNHAKIAPDGRRFTVKLRWRHPNGPWTGDMGVSLTCGLDGTGVALLADATSHVLWLDGARAYYWRRGALALTADRIPRGEPLRVIGPGVITSNVHLRHLPPGSATPAEWVFDTPYRETVDLMLMGSTEADPVRIASFAGHVPPRGPYRCDLHPVPDAAGDRIVVTSMADGGRQVYLLRRDR